ncbi:nicotinate-nucleotide adenylyltransferase [Marinobacter daqiaonensis]|uniref:Probable nicotinate-nucleotide adenylyltransferase n=1 Tax=Marinobacter daqiaonensis TaxID=650891 RepID=A0A1I6J4M4_9GAMM|nr:nicotinate-nucleotide adenylyltransferase [Marinobacter daqiaonensis]SFR73821.1 nicotinate-nucleotide adenylyltransferase [Marinobacter daqiaonensis]
MHVIYGGTFDPIHHGHLRVAVELRERLSVDSVHLVPSHIPPHRGTPGGNSQDRLELLQLAVAGEPGLRIDTRELDREGQSYTADTLRQLRGELGADAPLAMVVGTDSFAGFDKWREWKTIPELAHIILVRRPGSELEEGSAPAAMLAERVTRSPADLHRQPCGRILEMDPPLLDISATGIRQRLEDGRSVRFLIPDPVLEQIRRRGLYREGRKA